MAIVDWQQIDTLLLDMDGTLLDRKFDNHLWEHLLPKRYCEAQRATGNGDREELFAHMHKVRHTLQYYQLDYWTRYTGVDLLALHHEIGHLIDYRPGAKDFLDWIRSHRVSCMLVTNAQRDCLAAKDAHSNLCRTLTVTVSSHDYGHPKESESFWMRLNEEHPFDAARTLLIDDDQIVLDSASAFGIRHLLTVRQPDSKQPFRRDLRFPAFNDFNELMPVA